MCWVTVPWVPWVTVPWPYACHYTDLQWHHRRTSALLQPMQCISFSRDLLFFSKESLPAIQPKYIALAIIMMIKAWHNCSHAPPHHATSVSQGCTTSPRHRKKPPHTLQSILLLINICIFPSLMRWSQSHTAWQTTSVSSPIMTARQHGPQVDLRWPAHCNSISGGCKDGTHSFVPRAVSTMPVLASSTRRSCASMALVTACTHMMQTTSH